MPAPPLPLRDRPRAATVATAVTAEAAVEATAVPVATARSNFCENSSLYRRFRQLGAGDISIIQQYYYREAAIVIRFAKQLVIVITVCLMTFTWRGYRSLSVL